MSFSFYNSYTICCTCIYWSGTRRITLGCIEIEDISVQGQCCNSKSPWFRIDRYADCLCHKWKSIDG